MNVSIYDHNGPVAVMVASPAGYENYVVLEQGMLSMQLMLSDDGLSDLARMCEVALMERAIRREVKLSEGTQVEQVSPLP